MSTATKPAPPAVQQPHPPTPAPARPPRVLDEGRSTRADSFAFFVWVFFAALMAFLLLKDLVRSLLGLF
jgi:hypothetical protein